MTKKQKPRTRPKDRKRKYGPLYSLQVNHETGEFCFHLEMDGMRVDAHGRTEVFGGNLMRKLVEGLPILLAGVDAVGESKKSIGPFTPTSPAGGVGVVLPQGAKAPTLAPGSPGVFTFGPVIPAKIKSAKKPTKKYLPIRLSPKDTRGRL